MPYDGQKHNSHGVMDPVDPGASWSQKLSVCYSHRNCVAEPARGGDLTLVQPPPPLRLLPLHLPLLPRPREPQVVRPGGELVHLGEEGLCQVLSVPGESNPHLESETSTFLDQRQAMFG